MSGSISPTDLCSATEQQTKLWSKSRQVAEEIGDEVYTRTEPPVIVADETIGNHEYDETQAERERRTDATRPEPVRTTAAINEASREAVPSTTLDSHAAVWEDIAERGEGIYTGLHPVMERDEVYIYGCPHFLVFEDEQPVQVLRLRGTKYVERPEPYPSQMVGPWLTCRILERGRFDVSELKFTVIRYDRREYTDPEKHRVLTRIHQAYATDDGIPGVNVSDAVDGYNDISVDTYDYEARFNHDSADFAERLRRSIEILRGERDPGDIEDSEVPSLSDWIE